jgi:sugar phosphate isomerase/epimerase
MAHSLDIRIGTLVDGKGRDPVGYIRQILPYGFESFSLTFWQTLGQVDLPRLADQVLTEIAAADARISCLSIYGNPLEATPIDLETRQGWETLIDQVGLFGADLVTGFTGRLRGRSIDASLPRFAEVFAPLAERAGERGVRLAFENCPMGGNWQSGDWNIAHNPAAWERMFAALPAPNLGLEWEPCHQLVELIDPLPQLRSWTPRIFHLHGKDATIKWDVIRQYGLGGPEPYAFHRTPGFGDTNWTDLISDLRRFGFSGAIDIEGWHDPVYRDDLEMTGQVAGLNYLKACRGGKPLPNPT